MADRKKGGTPAKSRAKAQGKPATDARTVALGIAGGLGAIAAIAFGFLGVASRLRRSDGHAAPDLAPGADPVGSERAPEHFRPDPTAPVSAADREALRPATGPVPSIASPRGEMANQTGAANG